MDSATVALLLLFPVSIGFFVVLNSRAWRAGRLPLPPGPKTSWFDNTAVPKLYPWKTYTEWRKAYGTDSQKAVGIPKVLKSLLQAILFL